MAKLSSLENGAAAYVRSIGAGAELRNRLYNLGFMPGERVERLYASPLGTPVVAWHYDSSLYSARGL